jgi:hypothetical protein
MSVFEASKVPADVVEQLKVVGADLRRARDVGGDIEIGEPEIEPRLGGFGRQRPQMLRLGRVRPE